MHTPVAAGCRGAASTYLPLASISFASRTDSARNFWSSTSPKSLKNCSSWWTSNIYFIIAPTTVASCSLFYRGGLHINKFPYVPIGILETVPVHESVILRFAVSAPAGSDCFSNCLIDVLPAFGRESDQHFGALRGIANLLWSERLELLMG